MSDVFRIQGLATIFGSQYNLSRQGVLQRDPGDNSKGFYSDPRTKQPYDTFSKTLLGSSLPIPIIDYTIGYHGGSRTRQEIEAGHWTLVGTGQNDKTVTCIIVDIGPSVWTHHVLDLTFDPAHILEIDGLGIVDYEIRYMGKAVPIKGWEICHGQPGPNAYKQVA
jgi:hypothetical protein